MPRLRAVGTRGSPGSSLNSLGTSWHPGSPQLSSSSGTTSGEVTGQQNPTATSRSGKPPWRRARLGYPTFPGQTPRAGVDGPALKGSRPPALPKQPPPRAARAGVPAKPVGGTYRPALRGMLSSWPRPAAPPPRWVSRGQQALGGVTRGG